jgi:hypothetical protein
MRIRRTTYYGVPVATWRSMSREDRRAAMLAVVKRRRIYRATPVLPPLNTKTTALKQIVTVPAPRRVVKVRRSRASKPKVRETRVLKPRPKPERSNKRLYCRGCEHARYTFGRAGIGLLTCFADIL